MEGWDRVVVLVPGPSDIGPEGATIGGAEVATTLGKVRLPTPRREPRGRHVLRALVLLAIGLYAVLDPDGITAIVVVVIGAAALWFAFLEVVAAWRSRAVTRPPDRLAAP